MLPCIEVVENLLLAHAHGFEQDGGRHLAAPVYADVEYVLVVKIKIQPGAAHGDNAARIENLAAGVRLAAIVLENDARRALQLVDDNTFRAVDDECAFFRHQGQGAKIDILLLDVAEGTVAGVFIGIVNCKAHLDAHGGFIGQALGNTFGLIVLGGLYFVSGKLQAGRLAEIFNGKNRAKNAFKANVGRALLRGNAFLKKSLVRIDLQIQQMGDGERNLDLAELFGDLDHGYLIGGGCAPVARLSSNDAKVLFAPSGFGVRPGVGAGGQRAAVPFSGAAICSGGSAAGVKRLCCAQGIKTPSLLKGTGQGLRQ